MSLYNKSVANKFHLNLLATAFVFVELLYNVYLKKGSDQRIVYRGIDR